MEAEQVDELIEWIKKKFEVRILTSDMPGSLTVEEIDFWKEMNSNRVGKLF